jgi:hypothetical protein
MKTLNIAVLGALAAMTLSGCEMKDELWGGGTTTDSGALEVAVSVKQPLSQSRATDESISTDDFPVTIKDAEGTVIKKYAHLSEVPESVTLPVGDYVVESNSDMELEKTMTVPYYGGEKSMTITKGITTQTEVVCKMQNSRMSIKYGDDFKTNFSSWLIVLSDGSDHVLEWSSSDTSNDDVFWLFDDNVTTINVSVVATTSEGNTVSETRSFTKADAQEAYDDVDENFTGGDALVISMGATTSSYGNVTGVTVNTSISFADYEGSYEIPVSVNNPITIEEPEGNSYFTDGVTINNGTYPKNVELDVTTTRGIQSAYLTVNSDDNASLVSYAASIGLGVDSPVDLTTSAAQSLSSLINLPTAKALTYNLVLGDAFMNMIKDYAGTHRVRLNIVDVNGNSFSRTIYFTVTKTETPSTSTNPTVEFEGGNDEVTFSISSLPSSFKAYIKAPNGIESIVVKITAGNEKFRQAIADLSIDFINGADIVDNEAFVSVIDYFAKGTKAPSKGDTSFDFPIDAFLQIMSMYGTTDEGKAHEFEITVTDQLGNSVSATLKIHLTA